MMQTFSRIQPAASKKKIIMLFYSKSFLDKLRIIGPLPRTTVSASFLARTSWMVIAFELTILFGAGATILGLLFHMRRDRQPGGYDGRFTDDRIGIFVSCPAERRDSIEGLFRETGAEEVRVEA